MDYKNMNAEELIRIISNKALNKTMKENDKLIIQDCCKELFEKKCHKYKKITYVKSKATYDECEMGLIVCNTSVKTRIVEVIDKDNLPPHPLRFPEKVCDAVLEENDFFTFKNLREEDTTFTILEVEDI
jgi:hypothetical protein